MASARNTIRDAYARGEYERAKAADGIQISLSHQGAAGVSLWVRLQDLEVTFSGDGGYGREHSRRVWRIPLQTGFTGAISEGDQITLDGTVYVVRTWTTEKYDAIYLVDSDTETVRRSTAP